MVNNVDELGDNLPFEYVASVKQASSSVTVVQSCPLDFNEARKPERPYGDFVTGFLVDP